MELLKLLNGKNILRLTLILLFLATLYPPLEEQSILYFHNRYFLLTLPKPWHFVSVGTLFFEYLLIILVGLFLYTFKRD